MNKRVILKYKILLNSILKFFNKLSKNMEDNLIKCKSINNKFKVI